MNQFDETEETVDAPVSDQEVTEPQEPAESLEEPENGAGDPTEGTEEEPDTFPREYVEKLRKEAADNRVKAKRVDELEARLFNTIVAGTGRLADPTDLPFNPELLDTEDGIDNAISELLQKKPHLASRKPRGDIGQGAKKSEEDFSLFGLMQAITDCP